MQPWKSRGRLTRLAFLRHLIALLESQPRSESRVHAAPDRLKPELRTPGPPEAGTPNTPFLGQFKTLLTGPELPVASDVAVPWDIAYFIEYLRPKLPPGNAEFLTALATALNDRTNLPDLDRFPEWRDQPPVPLDRPWPE